MKLLERLAGSFGIITVRRELEIGVVLDFGLVQLLQLLRGNSKRIMRFGVVGLCLHGVFAAHVSGIEVIPIEIKLRDTDVFVNTLVRGLELPDLR